MTNTKKPTGDTATKAPKVKKLTDAERLDRVESTLQSLGHIAKDEVESEETSTDKE